MHIQRLYGLRHIASALLAVAVAFGATLVSHSAEAATIYACVSNLGGNVRVVSSTTTCRATESPLSWNSEGVPGPAGPPGPAGTGGPAWKLVDSVGQEVGRAASDFIGVDLTIVFEHAGRPLFLVLLDKNHLIGPLTPYFSTPDCSGVPYYEVGTNIDPKDVPPITTFVGPPGRTVYIPDDAASLVQVEFQSYYHTTIDQCLPNVFSGTAARPLVPLVDLDTYFTPPYHVEMVGTTPTLP